MHCNCYGLPRRGSTRASESSSAAPSSSFTPDFKPPRRSFTTSRMFRPLPAKFAVSACAALVLLTALPAFAEFPAPYNSEPDTNSAPMPPAQAAAKLQLPPGFKATVFAAEPDVQNPIAIAWDARG